MDKFSYLKFFGSIILLLKKGGLVLSTILVGNVALAVEIHPDLICDDGLTPGTLEWSTFGGPVDWPTGATSLTVPSVDGTLHQFTITFSGSTGNFAASTPRDDLTSLSGGDPGLTSFVNPGLQGSSITLTIDISPPVQGQLAFDLYHVNGSGFSGDQMTLSSNGGVPTFTDNGSPSWQVTDAATGFIQATGNSTTGTNDQVGVNYDTGGDITQVTILWEDCTNICGPNQHGFVLGNIDFCPIALPDAIDDSIDGSSLVLPGDMLSIDPLTSNGNGADSFGDNGAGVIPLQLIDPLSGLAVSSITTVNGGTVTVDDGGTPSPADDTLIYTAPDTMLVTIAETFDYEICDSTSPVPDCDRATITLSNVTTPVTFARVIAEERGERLVYEWETLTETMNYGFNIWGEVDGEWIQLNRRVIASGGSESLKPKSYRWSMMLTGLPGVVTRVGLSSVDINGREEFYGPFEVGEETGAAVSLEAIPWRAIDSEATNGMERMGYERKGRGWVKTAGNSVGGGVRQASANVASNALSGVIAEFRTSDTGIHRVTHAHLLAQGVDLSGIKLNELALTRGGEAVSRRIRGAGGVWGGSSFIDWAAGGVSETEALHTLEEVYRLEANAGQVLKAGNINRDPDTVAHVYRHQESVNRQEQYGLLMPQPDPWYQAYVATFGVTGDGDMVIQADEVMSNQGGTLGIKVVTITDFIEGTDHHIQVLHIDDDTGQTETVLGEAFADGYGTQTITVDIPAGLLSEGDNTFRLKLLPIEDDSGNTPSGYLGSALYLDRYTLEYRRRGKAQYNQLSFSGWAAEITPKDGYELSGFDWAGIVGYAVTDTGLDRLKVTKTRAGDGSWTVRIPEVAAGRADYHVAVIGALKRPVISIPAAVGADALDVSETDYLIISHPVFIDRLLNPRVGGDDYIAAKAAQGYRVKVIDVETVMQVTGHGLRTAEAIQRYIQQAQSDNPQLRYILLVGYASRDPHDYLNSGSWDFIPTLYAQTHAAMHFAPSDGLLADADDDGIQDLSLGRWPVRTIQDLDTVIAKTLKYQQAGGAHSLNKAVLSADSVDVHTGLDFAQQMDRLGDELNSGWSLTRVYKDQDGDSATGNLTDAINQGQTITAYAGHGGPGQWSYNNVFSQADVDGLNNHDNPTLVLPLTCYTTYYVNETLDTLGNRLLISTDEHGNDRGAVALFGASTLSGYGENEALTRAILGYMLPGAGGGLTLGEAIVKAKHDIGLSPATTSGNLLGDPTISIEN